MSVQMQQFRVVGVNSQTGKDVSVIVDAATKAAAEVKAEQMHIETTHIVRIKQPQPTPPTEHELFSKEAVQALVGKRTHQLIEEVVPPEEAKVLPDPAPVQPPPAVAIPEPNPIVTAITRPIYAAPSTRRESAGSEVSGIRAFGLVLLVLMGICAGAYFVLVHEPNAVKADNQELLFGQDLFSDVVGTDNSANTNPHMRDAFANPAGQHTSDYVPPIAPERQIAVTPAPTTAIPGALENLVLQSIVSSHEGRFAIINGKLYRQGADVNGATLTNIADNWVVMQRGDEQFVLEIEAE